MEILIFVCTAANLDAANAALQSVVRNAEITAPLSADGNAPATHYACRIEITLAQLQALVLYPIDPLGGLYDGAVDSYSQVLQSNGLLPVTQPVTGVAENRQQLIPL